MTADWIRYGDIGDQGNNGFIAIKMFSIIMVKRAIKKVRKKVGQTGSPTVFRLCFRHKLELGAGHDIYDGSINAIFLERLLEFHDVCIVTSILYSTKIWNRIGSPTSHINLQGKVFTTLHKVRTHLI